MKITIFKSITNTDTPHYVTPQSIIKRIKEEKDLDLVHAIRGEKNKDRRNDIKRKLPAICWSGTFTNRSDAAIIDHSGLICLDFDNYDCVEDLEADKETFSSNPFVYAVFMSPSGNGLKVVLKIPNNAANHRSHFKALKVYFNNDHFDISCINESRVCYSSCDPDVYVNEDSKVFTEFFDDVEIGNKVKPILFEHNENMITENLIKWWEGKFEMTEGGRNNNLHVLASALNRYGVNATTADQICKIQANGLPQHEVQQLVRSAYNRTNEHSTQFFEAKKHTDTINHMTIKGDDQGTIAQRIAKDNDMSIEAATVAVKEVQDKNPVEVFWQPTQRGIKIISYKYKSYLKGLGIYKYYAVDSQTFVFVMRTQSKIFDISEELVKDLVLQDQDKRGNFDIWDHLASNPRYFKEDYLSMLDNCDASFIEDDKDTAFLYFDNTAIKVTKDKVEPVEYSNLDGNIWGKHCLEREYLRTKSIDNDFKTLIWNISGQNDKKRLSIESTIGFLLHSYKTSARNRAVILNDEMISENPNGGTGKGLFINAIACMKRIATIDGKNFASDKSFAYQTVQVDTQVLCLDDIKKNFNFESLFSIITEGITLEKKNKDAIKLPIAKSPKLLISTNYAVKGEGNSFERRKWELEFAQYYNSERTPIDEFGRMLFDDWDADEWHKFDNYMISCLQLYLENGLIEAQFNNLETRKFIAGSTFDFHEWMTDTEMNNFEFNYRQNKKERYEQFLEDYPDYKKDLSAKKFNQWVESYARHLKLEYYKGSSNGQRWHAIVEKGADLKVKKPIETPF